MKCHFSAAFCHIEHMDVLGIFAWANYNLVIRLASDLIVVYRQYIWVIFLLTIQDISRVARLSFTEAPVSTSASWSPLFALPLGVYTFITAHIVLFQSFAGFRGPSESPERLVIHPSELGTR